MAKLQKNKTTVGWSAEQLAKDQFSAFCDRVGSRYQEDFSGALIVWQYLPAAVREQAKLAAKGLAQVDEDFWRRFGAGVDLAFQHRQDSQETQPDR